MSVNEHAADVSVALLRRLEQGSRAVVLAQVVIGTMVEEEACNRYLAVLAGQHELCAAVRRAAILARIHPRLDYEMGTIQRIGTVR